uniref:Uncharacterized protein n=1 Tax=Ochrobactrum phage ORM_20 TaxID=2985243 RepID=A0A9N6WWT4_9VIRU|nr:hypothetical protein ORM20_00187 [Ochrobactrum phage ORM_20]
MKFERLLFKYSVSDECTYSYSIMIPIVAADCGEDTVKNIFETFRVKSFVALEEFIKTGKNEFKFQGHSLDVMDFWKLSNHAELSKFHDYWVEKGDLVLVDGNWYLFSDPEIFTLDTYFKDVEKKAKDL